MASRSHPSTFKQTINEAIELLPIAIGVCNEAGEYLALAGGLAPLLGGGHPTLDPSWLARWRLYDDLGAELPVRDWPSSRVLRGEPAPPGVLAIFRDEDDQERHFRVDAAPVDLPDSKRGFTFLLRDAAGERLALERMQEHLEQSVAEIFADAARRVRRPSPLREEQPAPSAGPDAAPAPAAGLTQREQGVLRLFALGYSRKEIASRLGIAVKTADFYQAAGMRRAGLRNRIDIVQFAIAQGWMTPQPRPEIRAKPVDRALKADGSAPIPALSGIVRRAPGTFPG